MSADNLIFDLEVPFEIKIDECDFKKQIESELQKSKPNNFCVITIDHC